MMPMRRALVLLATALGGAALDACGLSVAGSASDVGAADATVTFDTSPPPGSGVDASAPTDAPADVDGLADQEAAVDAGPPTSCKDLLARDPTLSAKNAIYAIQPAGHTGAPLDVYCEMTVDNGGWTLVGRSAAGGGGAFGWKSAAGSVADELQPYSLDVAAAKLLFTEIMASNSAAGKPVDTRAYKLTVPADFLTNGTNLINLSAPVKLVGTCTPTPGTVMFQWAGATSDTDVFFFRDINNASQHNGLTASRWDVTYSNCAQGADLEYVQGAIFVR